MDRYHWTYQCNRCFTKSGHGFTGTALEASDNAPSCCGGEMMGLIRGNKVVGERCGAYSEHWEEIGKPEGGLGCSLPKGHEGDHRDKEV